MTIINCDKIVLKVGYIFQTFIKIVLTYVRGFVVFVGCVIIKIFKDGKKYDPFITTIIEHFSL